VLEPLTEVKAAAKVNLTVKLAVIAPVV